MVSPLYVDPLHGQSSPVHILYFKCGSYGCCHNKGFSETIYILYALIPLMLWYNSVKYLFCFLFINAMSVVCCQQRAKNQKLTRTTLYKFH